MTAAPTLVKIGGELLERPDGLRALAGVLARRAAAGPLVVVHGGGKEINAALTRAGLVSRQVDGIRVTDAPTLEVVVGVLAGLVNTRLVAAITAAGGRAVGLSGVDAALAPVAPAAPHRTSDGRTVSLGLVGEPIDAGPPALLVDLLAAGYVPVIASVSATADGTIHNVNADTLAGHLAARLRAARWIVAGATPGVLDEAGRTIPRLDEAATAALLRHGVASAGMIAKLRACRAALAAGVAEVVLVDGREPEALEAALSASRADLPATRMVA